MNFNSTECHHFLFVAVCRIPPAKRNLTVFEMKKPAVSDGHSVSVVSQIPNHVRRSCKGLLGVDDPVFVLERPGESIEGFAHLKRRQCSAELKLASTKRTAQQSKELSPELSS